MTSPLTRRRPVFRPRNGVKRQARCADKLIRGRQFLPLPRRCPRCSFALPHIRNHILVNQEPFACLPSQTLASFRPLVAALAAPGWASASDAPETPSALTGGKVISAADAKKLLDGKAATFVDTRSVVNFGKGHVPGALTAAYKEKSDKVPAFDAKADSFELDKLPKNKAAPLVFYSDGPTGWKSYKAAVLSVNAGYSNVHYMRGGFADWTAKALPVEQ